MSFDAAFARTVGVEGGYSNNPADRGGPTKYGITEKIARVHGYQGNMQDLTIDAAKAIYRKTYWDMPSFGDIDAISADMSSELFDTSVNMGIQTAARFFQRALNVFNQRGALYPDVPIDGKFGPQTLAAFKSYAERRGIDVLIGAMHGLKIAKYISIAEQDETQETFVYGQIRLRALNQKGIVA